MKQSLLLVLLIGCTNEAPSSGPTPPTVANASRAELPRGSQRVVGKCDEYYSWFAAQDKGSRAVDSDDQNFTTIVDAARKAVPIRELPVWIRLLSNGEAWLVAARLPNTVNRFEVRLKSADHGWEVLCWNGAVQ